MGKRPALPIGKIRMPRFRKPKIETTERPISLLAALSSFRRADDEPPSFLSADMDDTSAVIAAVTTFDRFLAILITSNLNKQPTASALSAVFDYPGPLSSFSAKIDLCYAMGWFTDEMKHDFDIIRTIRNKFCHSDRPISFSHPEISALISRIKFGVNSAEMKAEAEKLISLLKNYPSEERKRFTTASLAMFILLMYFIRLKVAQLELYSQNAEALAAGAKTKVEDFIGRMQAEAKKAPEPGSPPHPEGSSAPEKT